MPAEQPRLGLSVKGCDGARRGEGGRSAASSPHRRSRSRTRSVKHSFLCSVMLLIERN